MLWLTFASALTFSLRFFRSLDLVDDFVSGFDFDAESISLFASSSAFWAILLTGTCRFTKFFFYQNKIFAFTLSELKLRLEVMYWLSVKWSVKRTFRETNLPSMMTVRMSTRGKKHQPKIFSLLDNLIYSLSSFSTFLWSWAEPFYLRSFLWIAAPVNWWVLIICNRPP